jgi:hypothetical protein
MGIDTEVRPIAIEKKPSRRSFLSQVLLLTRRNLITIARTPEALLPPIDLLEGWLARRPSSIPSPMCSRPRDL